MISADILYAWKCDILKFCLDNFDFNPDEWQKEFLIAFASGDKDKQRISLNACAGPGKTCVLAIAGWWFLSTQGRKGNHPKGAALSITGDNLKDNLWSEFSKWQSLSKFLLHAFKWTKTRIYSVDHPETWFISARSWSKDADPETQGRTLSGLHSDYILFLIDESGDIPVTVLRSAEQALGKTIFGKIVQAGNPTSQTGMLYAAYSRYRDLWKVISITGDPEDPKRSPRIDIEWAQQQIDAHGRDNPWVMSYILGKFPATSTNSLLSHEDIEKSMGGHLNPDEYNQSQMRIGVDVAGHMDGSDSTVIFCRQGLASFNPITLKHNRGPEIAAVISQENLKRKADVILIDSTGGFGYSCIDSLKMHGIDPQPIGINFAEKASKPGFFNKRAEMYWEMAEWVKRGGVLPNHPTLMRELTNTTYSLKNGQFIIQPKEIIKKQLGFSPDAADALALTFAIPEAPKKQINDFIMNRHVHTNQEKYQLPF